MSYSIIVLDESIITEDGKNIHDVRAAYEDRGLIIKGIKTFCKSFYEKYREVKIIEKVIK